MNIKTIVILLWININLINNIQSVPRLMIKIPTRSRPAQFFNALNSYYNNLSGQIPVFFLITCDEDDKSMNNERVLNKLRMYRNLHIHFNRNKSKIDAYNKDIDSHSNFFDILLVASDDAYPIVKGYDKIIVDQMLKYFPDFDGVLNFYDGYAENLNTLPIMGKKYYDRFKYIYHPSYRSLYCDNELTIISRMLGKEVIFQETIIKHEHPANNQNVAYDSLYIKNDKWFNHDLNIFRDRRDNNFFIQEYKKFAEKKLSVLICTLQERESEFYKIYNKLSSQIKDYNLEDKIEILFLKDNKESSIGYKRNELIKKSKGEYICFLEDSDDIDKNYIKLIYEKLQSNPDCVSLAGKVNIKQHYCDFFHSINYKNWIEKDGIYYSPPTHRDVIKKSIAIQFSFLKKNGQEDYNWSMLIANSCILKREETIKIPIVFT